MKKGSQKESIKGNGGGDFPREGWFKKEKKKEGPVPKLARNELPKENQ